MRLAVPVAVMALSFPFQALAQAPAAPAPVAAAAPADVASPEAIVAALYDVISGDAGVARDWDRFRSLFHPAGRLAPSGASRDGQGVVRVITPDEYIARSGPLLEGDGFHEREIARQTERFGHIAHVWSTYESRRRRSDAQPFARGINSIQLFNDGARWWVISVYWQAETPTAPLPVEYLPTSD